MQLPIYLVFQKINYVITFNNIIMMLKNSFYNIILTQMELASEMMTIPGYTKNWSSVLPNGETSGELSASNKEKWTIFRVIPCY